MQPTPLAPDAEEPAALVWPPTMTPERAEYVRRALVAIFGAVIDSMLSDLEAEPSTEVSSSLADRAMLRVIRSYMPRIRGMFLGRLADTDPAVLERLMGALATTTEQILAQAPGEPLERWRFVWQAGDPLPRMVPDTWRSSDG